MKTLSQAAKAVYATVAAGLGALLSLLVGAHQSIAQVNNAGWVSVALTAILAGGGVYNITNAKQGGAGAPP